MRTLQEWAKDLITLGIYTGGGMIVFFAILRILRRAPAPVSTLASNVGNLATPQG